MIIVAGRIYVRPGSRPEFLSRSADAMKQARETPGCVDFVVAADPLDPDRVNIFEKWMDKEALDAFRDGGPDDDLSALIVRAEVEELSVATRGPEPSA